SATVKRNTISATVPAAIDGETAGDPSHDGSIRITDNDIEVTGAADGIALTDRFGVVIQNNRISGTRARGRGIFCGPSADAPAGGGDVDIEENTVTGCGTGIAAGAGGSQYGSLLVARNTVTGNSTAGLVIRPGVSSEASVFDNHILNNGRGARGA